MRNPNYLLVIDGVLAAYTAFALRLALITGRARARNKAQENRPGERKGPLRKEEAQGSEGFSHTAPKGKFGAPLSI
jgi:hypothetical protein